MAPALAMALAPTLLACASPNRGTWRGTFTGGVSGTMEFTIDTRGTRAEGRIVGSTREGQAFEADFEGSLNVDYLKAEFTGSSDSDLGLRAGFEGTLDGTVAAGAADGRWNVTLRYAGTGYEGTWQATQTDPP